jgi:hypothetical protein
MNRKQRRRTPMRRRVKTQTSDMLIPPGLAAQLRQRGITVDLARVRVSGNSTGMVEVTCGGWFRPATSEMARSSRDTAATAKPAEVP